MLRGSCEELERQIRDLEALVEENEKKEKEWDNIRWGKGSKDWNYMSGMGNTEVKDFMTLTMTFILKIAHIGFCCHRGHSYFTDTPVLIFLLL